MGRDLNVSIAIINIQNDKQRKRATLALITRSRQSFASEIVQITQGPDDKITN